MTGGIFWLASFPKSGNTWMRAFLANYLHATDQPVPLDHLGGGPIASDRYLFDQQTGIAASDLWPKEILYYRPRVYESLAAKLPSPLVMKTHDAFIHNDRGEPLFAPGASLGALYLVRNPLDVCLSMANHNGETTETTIQTMADPKAALSRRYGNLPSQLEQKTLSWSGHVLSWLDQIQIPLLMLRYEDMLANSGAAFEKAVRFLRYPWNPAQFHKAIEFSSFSRLKNLERESGFKEKSSSAESFFHHGRAGRWKEVLSEEQIRRIVNDHKDVMERLGYL